jgi:hypothetical protein
MKNLFIIVALMITLAANSQSRIGHKAKDIFYEFESQGIEYMGSEDEMYLLYHFNENLIIEYLFNKDSICDRVLVQTFTQEMTDFIVNTYEARGYIKIHDGWLARNNGIIYKIAHKVQDDNTNLFLWY